MTSTNDILKRLRAAGSPATVVGMARYGIRPAKAYGVATHVIRSIAKELRNNPDLASALWSTNVLEARMLDVRALVHERPGSPHAGHHDRRPPADSGRRSGALGARIRLLVGLRFGLHRTALEDPVCLAQSARVVPPRARIRAPRRVRAARGAGRPR